MADNCNCPPLYTPGPGGVCNPLIPGLPQFDCNTPHNPAQEAGTYAASQVVPNFTEPIGTFIQAAVPRIALFIFALIVLIIGFRLLR